MQNVAESTITQFFDFESMIVPAVDISSYERERIRASGRVEPTYTKKYTVTGNSTSAIPNTAIIEIQNIDPEFARGYNQKIFCAMTARLDVAATVSWGGINNTTMGASSYDISFASGTTASFTFTGAPRTSFVTLSILVPAAGTIYSPPVLWNYYAPFSIYQYGMGGSNALYWGAPSSDGNRDEVFEDMFKRHSDETSMNLDKLAKMMVKGFKALSVELEGPSFARTERNR
jgi:hypothetical protein